MFISYINIYPHLYAFFTLFFPFQNLINRLKHCVLSLKCSFYRQIHLSLSKILLLNIQSYEIFLRKTLCFYKINTLYMFVFLNDLTGSGWYWYNDTKCYFSTRYYINNSRFIDSSNDYSSKKRNYNPC
jgi:hypothetical protein